MTDYCIHTVPFQILPPPVTLLQEKCIGGRGKVLLVLSVLANDRFLSSCCWRWLSETSDVLGVSLGSLYVWVSTLVLCQCCVHSNTYCYQRYCIPRMFSDKHLSDDKRLQAFSPWGLRFELIPLFQYVAVIGRTCLRSLQVYVLYGEESFLAITGKSSAQVEKHHWDILVLYCTNGSGLSLYSQ